MTGSVSAVPGAVRDLFPHSDFLLLPAVMDQHLGGIPEIVPEYVKCRPHRHKRIGKLERKEHGEGGVLLSERLTRLPAPVKRPPAKFGAQIRALRSAISMRTSGESSGLWWMKNEAEPAMMNRVMTQRRKEKFASFEGHSFACLKNMRVTVAAAIGTPMMIARLIATSLKKNREKFPVTSGRSPSRDMLTPSLVMTNAATT